MLSDSELASVTDFVTGQLNDRQLRDLLRAASANPELRAALIELAPAQAALKDPELSAEMFGESTSVAFADTEGIVEDDTDDDQGFEELRDLIRKVCPAEWNIAGQAVVDEILHGQAKFAGTPGGHPLSATSALRTIVGVAMLLKGLLHLRRTMADLERAGADQSEIAEAKDAGIAALEAEAASTLRADRRKRAIDAVLGTPTP